MFFSGFFPPIFLLIHYLITGHVTDVLEGGGVMGGSDVMGGGKGGGGGLIDVKCLRVFRKGRRRCGGRARLGGRAGRRGEWKGKGGGRGRGCLCGRANERREIKDFFLMKFVCVDD